MRAWITGGVCLVLLLVAACANEQLQQGGGYQNLPPPPPVPDVRPDIPRTAPPATLPPTVNEQQRPALRQFLNTTLFVRQAPSGIVAGDVQHPFLVGTKLGDVLPLLTRQELRMLASRMPSLGGAVLRAEPYVRFDFGNETTGELRFVRDPDTQAVGTELFFEAEKPMFEYAYLLQTGAFPPMKGEVIDLFGHTYEVHEATNTSLQLFGKDVAQFVYLVNRSALEVNGSTITDTYVEVDPWHFTIRYLAPEVDEGGVRLKPGQDLRSKLRRPEMLLNPFFDIIYDGLEQNPNDTVAFRAITDGVRMDFFNAIGQAETLQLVGLQGSSLQWGSNKRPLHVTECKSQDDYCVAIDDSFLLTSRSGVTRAFLFAGVGTIGDVASFHNLANNEEHVVALAKTGTNISGNLILDGTFDLDGTIYHLRILHNATAFTDSSRMSIDMDGDGSMDGQPITVVTHALHELRFPAANQTNTSRLIEFASPRLTQLSEEKIPVSVTLSGGQLVLGLSNRNISLSQVNESQTYQGISERGVLVTLDHSTDGVVGTQLRLEYPPDFRAGLVRITG
jgi:hypothetical protein